MDQKIKELFNDEILKKGLSFYGFNIDEVKNKAGFESFIFEVCHNQEDYILRISHSIHRTKELMAAEIEFIYYLSNNFANVSMPIKSINDNLVETIILEDGSYFTTTVFTKALGKAIVPEEYSLELFETLGEAVGNLHKLAVDYKPINKRYSYFEEAYTIQMKDYIPKGKEIVLQKYEEILNKVKNHSQNHENYGLCHSDLHFGNMFVTDDLHITFFDFDDSMYTHFAFDIAIIFFYPIVFSKAGRPIEEKNELFEKYYPAFMKGYNRKYRIAKKDLSLIKDYAIIRAFDLYVIFHRSFDVNANKNIQYIVNYLEDVIINDSPIFDYNLIYKLS